MLNLKKITIMGRYYIIICLLIAPISMQAHQKKINSHTKPRLYLKDKQKNIKKMLLPLIASLELTPLVYSTLALLLGSLATIKPEEESPKDLMKETFEQKGIDYPAPLPLLLLRMQHLLETG